MDANTAVDMIVSTVKNSNLNFFVQESPFSLQINIRKTFIKNKDGTILQPIIKQNVKIANLEQENSSLNDLVKRLQAELFETRDSLHKLENEKTVEALINKNNTGKEMEKLKRKKSELHMEIETLRRERDVASKNTKSQEQEINVLEEKNYCLAEDLNPTSHGVSDSVAPMVGGLRGPPPKKSRKESFLTPCCYIAFLRFYI